MIPSKLYIPTTTLNFNNIMSSESISPASFYTRRQFGNKRFEKVEPNNLDNRIILYDQYPEFSINDRKLENYPMIIEIDTNTVNGGVIQEKDGFFYSDETIYLNPFSTKIIFNDKNEMRSTLSKAEPSIETKMVFLYSNCCCEKAKNDKSFKWQKNEIKDSIDDISKFISQDIKINKLKGFLYAYILAANKSLSDEVVALKKYSKELRNILSAILASPDGRATYKQQDLLNTVYNTINDAFYKAEGLDKKLKDIIANKQKQWNCDNFFEILQGEGVYDIWLQKQNIKPSFQLQFFSISKNSKIEEKERLFENYFSVLEKEINKFISPKLIQNEEFPELQTYGKIKSIPVPKGDFLSKLFNEYLNEAYNSDKLIQSRYEFAKSGGRLFREQMQDKWEGSESQMYINTLLKNLNEYSQFEINSTDNITLKSFAAFCQKGESDIDKLEDYLISNMIGDFRIAFALWGIIFGFANMPKTLTNDLFLSSDLNYISGVYKYIFKQIHNIDLVGNLEKKQEVSPPLKMNEKLPKTEEKKETTTQQQASEIEMEYKEKLKHVPKITSSQIDSVIEVLKNNHFLINNKLFDSISKIDKLGKRTNIYKEIKERLQSEKQQENNKSLSLFQNNEKPKKKGFLGNLFSGIIEEKQEEISEKMKNQSNKEFYLDDKAWSHIENLLPNDKKIREQVRTDLEWFQGNYQEYYEDKKKGKQKGFYFGKPTDNYSVIEKFQDYLNNKKNSSQDWLRKIYYSINPDKIITKLKELYMYDD